MDNTRNKTLDCYKGVLIILVCIRHILQHNVSDEGGVITNFIWAIQMPGFILISGYFSKKYVSNLSEVYRNILSKMRSYGLPFLSWYFLINIILLGKNGRDLTNAFSEIIYHVDSGLWFLWVVMILGIFASIINYMITINADKTGVIHKYISVFIIGLVFYGGIVLLGKVFGLKFLGIQYILYYSLYYWMGYIINIYQKEITKYYLNNKNIIDFLSVVIYLSVIYNFDLYRCEDNIVSIVLRIISALSGNLILFGLCTKFVDKLSKFNVDMIGLYTLEIYAVHVNVINLMQNNNTIGNAYSLYSLNGFLNFLIALFFMVLYTVIIIICFKYNKISDFLMFGKVRKI